MPKSTRKPGFTLIELLVVITIVVVLAALVMAISNRMIAKGKSATMSSNMGQIGALLTSYATDHQQQMMPCRGDVIQPDGSIDHEALWHEIILSMLNTQTDPAEFKTEDWWKANKNSIVRNPMFDETDSPRGWTPLNPGYAYNIMLPENYEINENGSSPDQATLEKVRVPMPFLVEPARIPIIVPYDNYYYRFDDAQLAEFDQEGTVSRFLNDGKFPVLFLDGHVEMLRPKDYSDRRLDEMPLP